MADDNPPPVVMSVVDRILSSEIDSDDVVPLDRLLPVRRGLQARPSQALGDVGP